MTFNQLTKSHSEPKLLSAPTRACYEPLKARPGDAEACVAGFEARFDWRCLVWLGFAFIGARCVGFIVRMPIKALKSIRSTGLISLAAASAARVPTAFDVAFRGSHFLLYSSILFYSHLI